MKDRNLLTSKKRFGLMNDFLKRAMNQAFLGRLCCRISSADEKRKEEEERIPFWDPRPRYPNGMNVRRSRSRHRVSCTASCATDASVQGNVLDRHRFRASEQESVLARASRSRTNLGTPENFRTFRRARGIHLDVRQFGAINVYHYHEEHCFVPQLNVSGLSKRKSVGPIIAQEIPDENAP
ncbi:hypothetical protein ALC53_05690 [Atta colombica]|uniref:Uncharacterized protein n=1 Tax=Atta colombica TaxID=520822 RepID=A0A195BHX1_9HYME|nr:hypothetical protein ALC53_05690 [Atta colombica]